MTFANKLHGLPPVEGIRFDDWFATLTAAQKNTAETARSILESLFNISPYLSEIAQKNTDWICSVLHADVDQEFAEILSGLANDGRTVQSEDALSIALRRAKTRTALLAAVAEVGEVWTSAQSTAALAALADTALEACLDLLMRQAADDGLLTLPPEKATAANSGLAIFALGKHGGRELNYSSDIDIVVFYDPAATMLAAPAGANKFYTRIMRHLVALMDERTEHGYVFRTDLRLRPDPGSTPVAISIDAALAYYEVRGQNWERAAWIKARPCAGDMDVAEIFLAGLAPFIWRKHLDFAAIADIQAMKRQINIARNVGEARVEGHNVKLGRGGIREIEFFTQTQQLIAGGRDPDLRVRPTTEALKALANAKWITEQAANELTTAYWYLRAVENRLQMIRDEQTHTMPETPEDLAIVAVLMGQSDVEIFKAAYRAALSTVMEYYAELFIEGSTLASDIGDLVFTGSDDDPNTLETLQSLGFADASKAAATVRKWHYGSYPATRAAVARAHLTELLPALLSTIAAAGNADDALARFDHFLSRFPAGVQLFSLLRNHTQLCHMLLAFMASAPRMADAVIHRAHVMDGLIDPAFADGVTRTDVLIQKVDDFLGQAHSFEDLIDRARIIGQEQKFLISAGFISGTVDAARAGQQFTTLAKTLLERLFAAVQQEFSVRHGKVPGAQIALLGFGKMASKEMTLASDLDFILLYDAPQESDKSDGEKPLSTTYYFSRLTQRLVAALSAPTAEGVLYETDMRLRPSGNAGPLATSISGFAAYQKDSAWTWEHLALTRARVIVAEEGIADKINQTIADVLHVSRDHQKIINDVISMRERLAKGRKPRHSFDLKLATGGIIDIEFIAQSAQLLEREKIASPHASTANVISRLGELDLLPNSERLLQIHQTYTTILQAMSICLTDPFKDETWTSAFRELLAELTNYPDFQRLEADLSDMAADVTKIAKDWYAQARKRSQ